MIRKETLSALVRQMDAGKSSLENMKGIIGFDGFIDEISKVVKCRNHADECVYFSTIDEYADHIKASAGMSADMEIHCQEVRLGGNAPIMANALGKLGVRTVCIGALGTPDIHTAFLGLPANCATISIAEPAYTYAHEFDDGKLMYGNVRSLDAVRWESLKAQVGTDEIHAMMKQSQFVGIVNWRYLYHMDSILEGILEEIFPDMDPVSLSEKLFFFDIADPAGRSMEDLLKFLEILERYAKHVKVVLGVNERECRLVYECLRIMRNQGELVEELQEIGKMIHDQLHISMLVIHTHTSAIGITDAENIQVDGFHVEKPLLSTGGGDNFNAGFCMARLMNLSLSQSLQVASAVSSFYVRNGFSPDFSDLIPYVEGAIGT